MEKLFWLRLSKDFFKRHDIRIIEAMPHGTEMVLFYIKLLCESLDHGGNLRFSEEVPYTVKMLATITDTEVDVAKSAIEMLIKLGLMVLKEDGTYYMEKIESMTSSASNSSGANRQRRYRERKALKERAEDKMADETVTQSVTQTVTKCNADRDDIPYQGIIDEYNEICVGMPKVTMLNNKRKQLIRKAYNLDSMGREGFTKLFERAVKSDFLNGNNNNNWKANFDWLIDVENLTRIFEGNFDNYDNIKDGVQKIARKRKLKELKELASVPKS